MKNAFNSVAQKVVDWDEFSSKKLALENKQFTVGEMLFEGFVDAPWRGLLWARRGFAEAFDTVCRRPTPDNTGNYYFNVLSYRESYFDREKLESDLAYFQKRGLGGRFQEKSAAIARQAFEHCRDFSCLVETGQLQKLKA
ncbi:MAG: hypothetical protein ACAH83_06870 [Alphaproteobacteria bacterium]